MQGYYQSARDVGQRVSTFFVGGGGRRAEVQDQGYAASQYQGGYNQQQGGYNSQQGGYSQGAYNQQQMGYNQGYNQQQGYPMQGGMGSMGMQGNMGMGMQGNNMNGMGGGMPGLEFNSGRQMQRPQQGGFQMTMDTSNKRRSPIKPGVRRKDGFRCTGQLMFALLAFMTVIIGGAITAGVVVSLNVNYRPPVIVAASEAPNSTENATG